MFGWRLFNWAISLPSCMTIVKYKVFLEHIFPRLLEDVSVNIERNMQFKHGRKPVHFEQADRGHEQVIPTWMDSASSVSFLEYMLN